ncbi:MAG: DegT/DnrJ/EryC1/StrS family aminotransferase [Planctomycetota bacterium]|nr:DegT/DnrJ/EryC1/StrS family aminotransferase [Planctomycetota bacterium]
MNTPATPTTPERTLPFLALGGLFEADDIAAAARVIEAAGAPGGNFFPLPEENEFQAAFAAHEGARAAVAVNSCGTALDLCMMVLDIKPGDEVITTPLTFICSATCASARGARIVFADVDPATLCLDPAAVEKKITPRTKAIIPVHFAGLAADVEGFDAITKRTGVPVIYDAAHAVGTRRHGKRVGGAGKASCYSFQSNKNITTLGEGGAVTTDDPAFAEEIRRRKTFGFVYGPQLRVVTTGFNYRMTKPQLAVGVTQTAKARRVIDAKLANMKRLSELLAGAPGLILPAGLDEDHGAHLYVVRLDSTRASFPRERWQAHLKTRYGIGTALHYPIVWSWEAFAEVDHDRTGCPAAERACREVLSLPVFAQSKPEEIEYLAKSVRQSLEDLK